MCMSKGNIWPIPHKDVINGGILARKNAENLLETSKILYQERKYTASLVFSTLGLEEYGKFLMFYDSLKELHKIDSKDWYERFVKHDEKLKSIPKILFKEKSTASSEIIKKEKKRIMGLLQKWNEFKFQSLYLDWNARKGKWKLPDDNNKTIEKSAKEALSLLTVLMKTLKKEGGDLVNETTDHRIELLKSKKAYVMCEKCGFVMFDIESLKKHRRHSTNQLSWFRMSP